MTIYMVRMLASIVACLIVACGLVLWLQPPILVGVCMGFGSVVIAAFVTAAMGE